MATSISCPSCNEPFGLPPSFSGGRATCPNPKCGKTFYAPAPQPAPGPGKPSTPSSRGRGLPVRPAAVSHIPPNIYASPAFVAGGGVFVMLYGMVLFAVLSSQRRDADLAYDEPAPAPAPALVFVEPTPSIPETKAREKPAPEKDARAAKPPAPAATPPKPQKGDAKPSAKNKPAPAGATAKPASPPKAKAPAPPPTEGAPPAQSPKPKPTPSPAPAAVALNTSAAKPAPTQAEASVDGATFNGLSAWTDPERSVKPRREEGAVIAAVPAGIHILSPELKHKDAPMSLAEVTGDFEIQVRVAGGIRPGSSPLKDVPVPIAFQGAGLLVWQDPDNYLRFERAAMSGPSQPLTQKVIVEVCRDGKPSGHVYKDTSDRPVFLRLTRRGDDLECAYSPDGKTWLSVKKSEIALFPSKVRVGILASNLSPKPFNPRFDAFTLDQSGGKAGSR